MKTKLSRTAFVSLIVWVDVKNTSFVSVPYYHIGDPFNCARYGKNIRHGVLHANKHLSNESQCNLYIQENICH